MKLEANPDPEGNNHDSQSFQDPNIVDWDGDDDPAHPRNWSKFMRNLHVVLASLFTLYASVLSSLSGCLCHNTH